jgi:hypothetical protein
MSQRESEGISHINPEDSRAGELMNPFVAASLAQLGPELCKLLIKKIVITFLLSK